MLKLRWSSVVTFALFLTVTVVACADTLNGAGSWQSWSPSTLGTSGVPFWNNASGDGPNYNVGWCLVGGGGCTLANPPGALPYFGNGTSDVSNMWFNSGGSAVTLSLTGVFTSQTKTSSPTAVDYFGYYTLNSSGNIASTLRLFSAADALATTTSLTIAANTNYGFYLENVQGQGTAFETDYWFYMDSTQNTDNRGIALTPLQHAAIFQNGATGYYVAFEDCFGAACDKDYNDMIVQMAVTSSSATPEPAPAALAGIGLLAFGLLLRARSK